jgi:hypothetical protein
VERSEYESGGRNMNLSDAECKSISKLVKEHYSAFAAIKVDTHWNVFEQSYIWFITRQGLSSDQQEAFHQYWCQCTKNKKKH